MAQWRNKLCDATRIWDLVYWMLAYSEYILYKLGHCVGLGSGITWRSELQGWKQVFDGA